MPNEARVELHLHLECAIRYETIIEIARKYEVTEIANNVEELRRSLVHRQPAGSLIEFLKPAQHYLHIFAGNLEAIERVAYELCEDQVSNGVVYFEIRFCPHLLSNTVAIDSQSQPLNEEGLVTPEDSLKAVIAGLEQGFRDFGVKARCILSCLRDKPEWSRDILTLCEKYQNLGVVAIDIAGCGMETEEVFDDVDVAVFQEAERKGIHRTVHAGEAGSAENVKFAIDAMKAERIGHGYHVVDNEEIYHYAKARGIHFETCPLSSYLTSSVSDSDYQQHPLLRFLRDDVNFSINTDDPTLTGNYLAQEIEFTKQKFLFTDSDIAKLQINAAKACFLPEREKQELLNAVRAVNESHILPTST